MTKTLLRQATLSDANAIFKLYRDVAKKPGGLARLESEISHDYIEGFIDKACSQGLILVAEEEGRLLGEIHAYGSGLFCFSHVLSELTIAVAPEAQGRGVGKLLFQSFLDWVTTAMPSVLRLELIARESNRKAIRFYESLGFVQEGCFNRRIRNPDGTLESDIPMAWCREA